MKTIHIGISVVEFLVLIAIICLLAAPFIRLKYGSSIRQWEHQKVEQLGVPLPVYYAILTPISLAVIIWRVKQLSQKRPSDAINKYTLPDEKK